MCRASLKRSKLTSVRKTKTRNEFAERSHATAAGSKRQQQQIFFMKVNLHFPTRLADCCLAAKLAHIEEWPCCVRQSINLWHGKFMTLRAIECVWNMHTHTHNTRSLVWSVRSRWQTNKKKMTSRFYGVPYPYVSQLPGLEQQRMSKVICLMEKVLANSPAHLMHFFLSFHVVDKWRRNHPHSHAICDTIMNNTLHIHTQFRMANVHRNIIHSEIKTNGSVHTRAKVEDPHNLFYVHTELCDYYYVRISGII